MTIAEARTADIFSPRKRSFNGAAIMTIAEGQAVSHLDRVTLASMGPRS